MRSRFNLTVLFLVLGSFAWCPAARAGMPGASRNPYRRILERNLFRLKPVTVAPLEPPHPPLPRIILTGITTILGDKRALLKIQIPAQTSQPAREKSCILREGQSDGPVQVLQIDVPAGSVRVNNSGTEAVLTFDKDGPGTTAAPARAVQPPFPRRLIRR